jgi:hypothetical protein
MAYIGKTPVIGNFVKLDSITVVNGQAAYTMQNGGVNFTSYDNVNQFLVSLNGVLQAPTDSFTVSGSTLTFASNLSTGDVIDFVLVLGNSLDIGTPSDNTVTAAKIGANAVTNAKLNNDIISGATELASEPADTDEFLVSDAGTLKRIDYSLIKGGGLTVADQWRYTGGTNFSTETVLSSDLERIDTSGQGTLGSGMTFSSGVFTFPSTGIYLINFICNFYVTSTSTRYAYNEIQVTTDNSSYTDVARGYQAITHVSSATYGNVSTSTLVDVTNTSNVKVKFAFASNSTVVLQGSTDKNFTHMTFLRLGDT